MGSGGYVVYDDSVCIVDMSRYFNRFNRYQSCGNCFPCRQGTKSLLEMTDRIAFGGGRPTNRIARASYVASLSVIAPPTRGRRGHAKKWRCLI